MSGPVNVDDSLRYYAFWHWMLAYGLMVTGVIASELLAIIVLFALLVRKG